MKAPDLAKPEDPMRYWMTHRANISPIISDGCAISLYTLISLESWGRISSQTAEVVKKTPEA